jgi:hypothetical protein
MVQERWPEEPEQRALCFEAFIEADWKTMIKEMSDEQVDDELVRLLVP